MRESSAVHVGLRLGLFVVLIIAGVGCVDREPAQLEAADPPSPEAEEAPQPESPPPLAPDGSLAFQGQRPDGAPSAPSAVFQDGRPQTFADLVERVMPAVVNIYTTNTGATQSGRNRIFPLDDPDRFGIPDEAMQSLGSGFLISDDGYILTNNHVVEGASLIKVRLNDEREFKAELVGTDPKTDIALIKIDTAPNLVPLQLGDSSTSRVGSWVVAIGNPLGLSGTVTSGIISARGRTDVPLGNKISYKDFIQTDASINPGNSGGALINLRGEVIGINTAISRKGQGIGFAIPINMAKDILPQLMTSGRVVRSWIGLFPKQVPLDIAEKYHITPGSAAMIDRVVVGGPAHQAGLAADDVVLSFDGTQVEKFNDLKWLASTAGVGKSVTVEVIRGGNRMTFTLVTEEHPH